jgi:predicted glycosyltransferase
MTDERPIWIDLDNAPHAHFFAPLIDDLHRAGHRTLITLRSFGQTEGLARHYGMEFTTIGSHRPLHSRMARARETFARAARLAAFAMSHRPAAAISHGSRALTLAAAALGVPCMALYDYEHIADHVFRLCDRVLVPEAVLNTTASGNRIGYPGFKEDVYVHRLRPDPRILEQLHLDRHRLIVTVRPPATWAHYHRENSTVLFRSLIDALRSCREAQVVVLARTEQQAAQIRRDLNLTEPPFLVTSAAVDGLSLIAYSDAVFSGGGTMVREAALLGVPAYSTFAGKSGAVDHELERLRKLTVLHTPEEIAQLEIAKQKRPALPSGESPTRTFILHQILELAAQGN